MNLMRTWWFWLVVAFATALPAQTPPSEFEEWMEAANQNVGRLILRLQEKDSEDARVAAQNLQNVFTRVASFFEEKRAVGPLKYAEGAREGFQKVDELLLQGKLDQAYKTTQETRANCENCHKEHRERLPDGTYRLKF